MFSFQQAEAYRRDGYLVAEHVFSGQEVERLLHAVEHGDKVASTQYTNPDASGRASKLAIWHDLSDDIWSAASTKAELVNGARVLLGEEVAFFHGKVMLKEAGTGGAWEWHQDYGYWYKQGFLYPHLISAFVALDEATIENGCLQVLKGSHWLGRLEHGRGGSQTAADVARMEHALATLELVHCELKPGSVLFFHSNLLHSSAANESSRHRRSFITCYTAVSNPQVVDNGKALKRYNACPPTTGRIV